MKIASKAVTVVALFMLVGALIPILWFVLYSAVDGSESPPNWMTRSWIDSVLLSLWPSSILLIADPEDSSLGLRAFSAVLNIGYFGFIGYLVWLGMTVSRTWFFVAAGVVVFPSIILSLV